MTLTVAPKFFGDEARAIANRLGIGPGESIDENRKVWFHCKSVEGHLIVEMEFDI